jgi:hypothetical protein
MVKKNILKKSQSKILWRTSWFCLFSSCVAFYNSHYLLAILPCSCFLTSINYWRCPDYSWRRYTDIIVVNSAISYQMYYAYSCKAENFKIYFLLMIISIKCFLLGKYYYNKKKYWLSTYFHALLHFFANVANIILYSGKIP